MQMMWTVVLVAAGLLAGCGQAAVSTMVPVQGGGTPSGVALQTRVAYPKGAGKAPVVVLLHGSSGGQAGYTDPWDAEIPWLTQQGYAVVAAMRRGRGGSTGVSAEHEDRHCEPGAWEPGLQDADADIDALMVHLTTLQGVDAGNVTLWGVSRGGFLAVRYAAQGRYRQSVRRVVNFVGGWVAQAEDQCPHDFNLTEFQRMGALTQAPTLWLYGEGDTFYGAQAPRQYAQAFQAAGGQVQAHLRFTVPANGHWLARYPTLWQPVVKRFLAGDPFAGDPLADTTGR